MTRSIKRNSSWRIFRWPLAIALASFAGLVSALLGDGFADVLSWVLLGCVPIGLLALYRRN